VELRHLRAFETVARTLSVTKAAEELHYAQSSVSEQIQTLERELGVELFDRSRRRLRLTRQGALLMEYADKIFGLVEEARYAVARPGAELVVGALETVGVHLLPGVLSRFRELCPEARVRVGLDNRGALFGAARRGEMDLCLTFGTPPKDSSLRAEILAEEPLVVIVPPSHALAGVERADLAALTVEPFLATEPGCGFREMFDSVFGATAAKTPIAEVSSIGTLSACVAAGMGLALLPLVAVRGLADRGEVDVVRIRDADLHTTVTMTWLDRNSANPTLLAFQQVLREQLTAG
jgi:DNA-binding transcriptional LysR family regulator